jgi:hypothetical protein
MMAMTWKPGEERPYYQLCYNIKAFSELLRVDQIPEGWNGADRLFVIAQVGAEPGADQYLFSSLDGPEQGNASPEATLEAWLAFTCMLQEHLALSDPVREALVSAEVMTRRAMGRGLKH